MLAIPVDKKWMLIKNDLIQEEVFFILFSCYLFIVFILINFFFLHRIQNQTQQML